MWQIFNVYLYSTEIFSVRTEQMVSLVRSQPVHCPQDDLRIVNINLVFTENNI